MSCCEFRQEFVKRFGECTALMFTLEDVSGKILCNTNFCQPTFHFIFIDTAGESSNLLTFNLLTTTIVAPPSNASKWQMGFNLAFKGLNGSHNA